MGYRRSRENITKKIRRHSGRVTSRSTLKASKKWIIDNCLEPQEFWDDWNDYRDGFRDWHADYTKFKKHCGLRRFCDWCHIRARIINPKLKLMLKRRKAMKEGRRFSL